MPRSAGELLKAALKLETRVVFMRANEIYTGVRHCVPAVAKLLKDQHSGHSKKRDSCWERLGQ
ncbi:Serine--glyoxylate aminotransferase [Granulicella sibirica]|uniref:Serine--glyoxylate aminotransferase n=1 Tax=Granulicella sibirica TaxID=2479048 RepID=A0A4V1L6E3_9BACT|nr:Serine--glyoxylate aminotransferase [Granulicella sibirica]